MYSVQFIVGLFFGYVHSTYVSARDLREGSSTSTRPGARVLMMALASRTPPLTWRNHFLPSLVTRASPHSITRYRVHTPLMIPVPVVGSVTMLRSAVRCSPYTHTFVSHAHAPDLCTQAVLRIGLTNMFMPDRSMFSLSPVYRISVSPPAEVNHAQSCSRRACMPDDSICFILVRNTYTGLLPLHFHCVKELRTVSTSPRVSCRSWHRYVKRTTELMVFPSLFMV